MDNEVPPQKFDLIGLCVGPILLICGTGLALSSVTEVPVFGKAETDIGTVGRLVFGLLIGTLGATAIEGEPSDDEIQN